MIAVLSSVSISGLKALRLVLAEEIVGDEIERGLRLRLILVVPVGVVPATAIGDLFAR